MELLHGAAEPTGILVDREHVFIDAAHTVGGVCSSVKVSYDDDKGPVGGKAF